MNNLKLSFAALCSSGMVSAWHDAFYDNYYPFGPRNLYNISAARQHANVSKTVSFAAGTPQLWKSSVSLAEIPAEGENATAVPDARVLLTLYDVHPPANWTGVQDPGFITPVQYPGAPLNYEFTWRATHRPFSTPATNAYNGGGDSDCAGVVNPTCLYQLSALNYSSAISPLETPACENVTLRWGGVGGTRLMQRSSLDDHWAWQLSGFISGVCSTGNRTLFECELQRVHLGALSANHTRVLCVRIDESEVSAADPGTGPAPNDGASLVSAALWTAMALTLFSLLL